MKKIIKALIAVVLLVGTIGATVTSVSAATDDEVKGYIAEGRAQINLTNPTLMSGAYAGDTMLFISGLTNEYGEVLQNYNVKVTLDAGLTLDTTSLRYLELDAAGDIVGTATSSHGAAGPNSLTASFSTHPLAAGHTIAVLYKADIEAAAVSGNTYGVTSDFTATGISGTTYTADDYEEVFIRDAALVDVSYVVYDTDLDITQTLSGEMLAIGSSANKPELLPYYDYSDFYTIDVNGNETVWDFATDTVTGDTVIYVDRTPKVYTVTLNVEGQTSTHSATYGHFYSTNTPKKAGYSFDGWYTEPTFVNKFDLETTYFTADTTLYAKFVKVEQPVDPVKPVDPTDNALTPKDTSKYVNTGVENNFALYSLTAGLAALGLGIVFTKRRKEAK